MIKINFNLNPQKFVTGGVDENIGELQQVRFSGMFNSSLRGWLHYVQFHLCIYFYKQFFYKSPMSTPLRGSRKHQLFQNGDLIIQSKQIRLN